MVIVACLRPGSTTAVVLARNGPVRGKALSASFTSSYSTAALSQPFRQRNSSTKGKFHGSFCKLNPSNGHKGLLHCNAPGFSHSSPSAFTRLRFFSQEAALPLATGDSGVKAQTAEKEGNSGQSAKAPEEKLQRKSLASLRKSEKTSTVTNANTLESTSMSSTRERVLNPQESSRAKLKPLKERLVILGCGWGGFRIFLDVDTSRYDVLLISPRNHYLFTPLLPSTATGTLEFRSIVEPARKARKGTRYHMAYANSIDTKNQEVLINADWFEEGHSLKAVPYDKLVIAVGARNNTFGIPGVEENTYFLKELSHARQIRRGIIECFEDASYPDSSEEFRKRVMNFVIVGGGPTGVEFAAELHDFVMQDLKTAFPELAPYISITLLEATDNVLGMFNKNLIDYTSTFFARQNINVRTALLSKK